MFDRTNRIWTVEKGDTLSEISARLYGDYRKYPIIQKANSDLVVNPDLIYPGWKLYIPPPENTKLSFTKINDSQDVLISINGNDLKSASQIKASEGSTSGTRLCAFSMPYDQNDGFKYGDSAKVFIGGQLFIDGILFTPRPSYSKDGGSIIQWQIGTKINNIINSQFKTERNKPGSWENISLKDLVDNVLKDDDITVHFSSLSVANQTYKKIGIGTESKFEFLQKIAQQKGFDLQGLATGDLLFSKAKTSGKPIASFSDANNISLTCEYDKLASEYRATNQKSKGGGSKSATNDFIKGNIFKQFQKDVGYDGDLQSYVNFKQAQEFASAIKIDVVALGLYAPDGELWKAKEFITVKSEEIGITQDILLLIDYVEFDIGKAGKISKLICVLPETRAGTLPTWLPFL